MELWRKHKLHFLVISIWKAQSVWQEPLALSKVYKYYNQVPPSGVKKCIVDDFLFLHSLHDFEFQQFQGEGATFSQFDWQWRLLPEIIRTKKVRTMEDKHVITDALFYPWWHPPGCVLPWPGGPPPPVGRRAGTVAAAAARGTPRRPPPVGAPRAPAAAATAVWAVLARRGSAGRFTLGPSDVHSRTRTCHVMRERNKGRSRSWKLEKGTPLKWMRQRGFGPWGIQTGPFAARLTDFVPKNVHLFTHPPIINHFLLPQRGKGRRQQGLQMERGTIQKWIRHMGFRVRP